MEGHIEFFEITYRGVSGSPAVVLLCQGVTVNEELMLWVDGINLEDPVVVPLAGIPAQWRGSYADWCDKYPDLSGAILAASPQVPSPVLMVRCMSVMAADPGISAHDALDMCTLQAQEISKEDRLHFDRLKGQIPS